VSRSLLDLRVDSIEVGNSALFGVIDKSPINHAVDLGAHDKDSI
jgi:hypothetical protein